MPENAAANPPYTGSAENSVQGGPIIGRGVYKVGGIQWTVLFNLALKELED